MSEVKEVKKRSFSPFITRKELSTKGDFDQYYQDISYKEIYRKVGVDSDGEEYGVIEVKPIVKKKSIKELLEVEAQGVGVEAYMRALTAQGESLEDYNTVVDQEKVVDYSQMPDTLAEVLTAGDRAKEAFAKLDPALKGSHTTIEGFLNSLTSESIDSYIKGKIDAILPKQEVVTEGGDN